MKNCVTSVCYSQSSGANSKSTLYLGDEQGNIAALTFLQPAMLLFSHKGMETQAGRAETIYWLVRIMPEEFLLHLPTRALLLFYSFFNFLISLCGTGAVWDPRGARTICAGARRQKGARRARPSNDLLPAAAGLCIVLTRPKVLHEIAPRQQKIARLQFFTRNGTSIFIRVRACVPYQLLGFVFEFILKFFAVLKFFI